MNFDIRMTDLVNVGIFAAVVILFAFGMRMLVKYIRSKHDKFLQVLYRYLRAPLQIVFLLTAIYILLQSLTYRWTDDPVIDRIYTIAIICVVAWMLTRAVQFFSALLLQRFDVDKRDNLSARRVHTQVRVVRRLIISVIVILALAALLMTFEHIRALGVSLLASAGVAGVVLGLAAQRTLGNFFIGLQIAITQPIRIDDAVLVEGEWGRIEEINLTYVVVNIWDHRRLVLPISYFVEKPFQNWTRRTADLIGSIILYLDYGMPMQALRDELDRLLAENPLWDGKVKVAQVIETTERTMQVRVLVSAADSPSTWDLRCQVREGLIAFIQKNYPESLPRFRGELGTAPGAEQKTGAV